MGSKPYKTYSKKKLNPFQKVEGFVTRPMMKGAMTLIVQPSRIFGKKEYHKYKKAGMEMVEDTFPRTLTKKVAKQIQAQKRKKRK